MLIANFWCDFFRFPLEIDRVIIVLGTRERVKLVFGWPVLSKIINYETNAPNKNEEILLQIKAKYFLKLKLNRNQTSKTAAEREKHQEITF